VAICCFGKTLGDDCIGFPIALGFETVTVAGYIDRKSKKQESGQMRIILHAGANKTDEDHLLFSLRRNLNLHHQNKIALPLPKNYRRPLRQRMMQSNHTTPDADAREILLDVFLDGEHEECRTLYKGIPGFFGAPNKQFRTTHFTRTRSAIWCVLWNCSLRIKRICSLHCATPRHSFPL
jgi:hypothetical protein